MNSTTVTVNADGSFQSEVRYSAYGEIRYAYGTTVTDKLYTGQQQETEIGLDYYIARFYDPVIAHFIQPDSLIPQASASASYDRYAYVNGNPINLNDPSGHSQACADGDEGGGCGSGTPSSVYAGYIKSWFNVKVIIPKAWNTKQITLLAKSLFMAANLHGGTAEFIKDVGGFSVAKTDAESIYGMVIPVPQKPLMVLNNQVFAGSDMGTLLHETGHVFDFNGKQNKSDSFIPFFSPGASCQAALLGCLNSRKDISYQDVIRFYSKVNSVVSQTQNFGYSPTLYGTTEYGAIGTIDDWAETYAVMALEKAGYMLSSDQAQIWNERKMIVQMFLNK